MDSLNLGAALTATIAPTFTFLYGRLTALLDRGKEDIPALEGIETPDVLEGRLEPLAADEAVLSERWHDLQILAATLGSYDRNPSRIVAEDNELIDNLDSLRRILESVYGQRFTFRGESRDMSGTRISQHAGKVDGRIIGVDGKSSSEDDLDIRQSAREIGSGGSMIGIRRKR